MKQLHFSIEINAPKEKVWDTMLSDATYRQWTTPFGPGCYFEGSWEKGGKISFLAPGEDGKVSGMVSTIVENRPYEFISIKHLGVVMNGVEDTSSEAMKDWGDALENYTFEEADGVTTLTVDVASDDNLVEDFEEMWPKAVRKLKELAEA